MLPPDTHVPRRARFASSLVLFGTLVAGCAPSTYTFSVDLKNASEEPVTAWLTKLGGPDETAWLAPETIARASLGPAREINGVVVPPGKTASIGPIQGKFDRDALAILRVYAGQLTFEQILATPEDGKLRIDVHLDEGANRLTVAPGQSLSIDPTK